MCSREKTHEFPGQHQPTGSGSSKPKASPSRLPREPYALSDEEIEYGHPNGIAEVCSHLGQLHRAPVDEQPRSKWSRSGRVYSAGLQNVEANSNTSTDVLVGLRYS